MKALFISLDTVCANRLSTLGATRVSTPNLDELARNSATFTQAYATDIPTQPSHTAIFTGRYGASTGIVSHFHPPAMLDESVPWLPSIFGSLGCRTGAVDHLFAMKDWFIRGYEDYMVPPGRSRSPASVINRLGLPWLEEHGSRDFFLFLHFWDAHIPYVPPEPFLSAYTAESATWVDTELLTKIMERPTYPLFKQNLYDHLERIPNLDYITDLHYAEVAYLDHELGRLFNRMADLGILDETMIVIFGDHGEIMTEHDAWFDHAGLYDSVVHVPLIIYAPGVVEPVRVDSMVALIDVMPTVLELLGLPDHPAFEGFDGRSLLPVMRGQVAEHRHQIELSECTWQAKRGLRTKKWKYIRCWNPGVYARPSCELYDLEADPAEQHDVSSQHPRVVETLGAELDTWLDTRLRARPDPMIEVIQHGLPAVRRLERLVRDQPPFGPPACFESAPVALAEADVAR